MNHSNQAASSDAPIYTNGSGAAAILSAGIGSFALAVLAIFADKWPHVKTSLTFFKPTGALSGVTTSAILIWLFAWGVLEWRWRTRTVAVKRTNTIALILLALSLLLTFPPITGLF